MKQATPSLSLLLLLWLGQVSALANGLPDAVMRELDRAGIPLDAVSVVVAPAEGSEVPIQLNAERPMNPASTMKLLTTYAALRSLGPTHGWKTPIWAEGEILEGRLMGNLIIRGAGDPFLTMERLWLLQRSLRQKGVREIHGNLVLDMSQYDLPPQDAGVFDGEPLAAYNAPPSPLAVNFNVQNLRLQVVGETVQAALEWPLPTFRILSTVGLSEKSCSGWRNDVTVRIPDPAIAELVVSGSFPRSCGEKSLALNVLPPALNFAHLFRALWEESGGIWSGSVVSGVAPALPPLLQFESLSLADLLRPINKFSSNIMTRMLYLELGMQPSGAPATLEKSAQALRDILMRDALVFPELMLENGSGLSRAERISAASMARLLQTATKAAHFSEFESSLPIAAKDGTLKSRMNGTNAQAVEGGMGVAGHAHLKTGSLRDVRALAGYVHDKSGQRWVVVFFINHPEAARGVSAQDALVEWVYQQGARQP